MDVTRRRGIFYSLMAMALLMPIAAFALYSAMHAQGEGAAQLAEHLPRDLEKLVGPGGRAKGPARERFHDRSYPRAPGRATDPPR